VQSFDGECWQADTDDGRSETEIVTAKQVFIAQAEANQTVERTQDAVRRLARDSES
jgi:hypothetical protein